MRPGAAGAIMRHRKARDKRARPKGAQEGSTRARVESINVEATPEATLDNARGHPGQRQRPPGATPEATRGNARGHPGQRLRPPWTTAEATRATWGNALRSVRGRQPCKGTLPDLDA
jgi:hypothetical protein